MKVNVELPQGSATRLIRNNENALEVLDMDGEYLTFQVKIGWKTLLLLSVWFINLSLNLLGVFPFPFGMW
jgi:hypothetical protein